MIHDLFTSTGQFLGKYAITRKTTGAFFNFRNPALEQNILGINFKNPIGLSAGFDKNAVLMNIMPAVGFGFTEIGSITALPYGGNTKPRLYRLPEAKSLRVNYGLKNLGAEVLHNNLKNKVWSLPVGINIAKTNSSETSDVQKGIADYFFTYKTFQDVGDYFTINISCPNTCEEKPIFAEPENLDLLLGKIFSTPKVKPVFVKISPDLGDVKLDAILEVCLKHKVDGFVCTNLTKINTLNHPGKGGFSGKLDSELSDKVIRQVYKKINTLAQEPFSCKPIIIGVGGIFTAEDAYKKIKAGASLVELITGMIFEGPQAISEINRGLVKLLKKDGYKNISEAIGKE
ncbi:quinone-dependent dihydroorotate dehydrogenase [Candidatus Nomurabacteria bacterium]|nr:quinone-dependent dihydroorotate dehydrogenase [Candidatus Nomurabacteria bacterium]